MKKQLLTDEGYLPVRAVDDFLDACLSSLSLKNKRVLVIVPDNTRTMPMRMMFDQFAEVLSGEVAALDYLVALGTHPPLSAERLSKLFGHPVKEGRIGDSRVFNHTWADPNTFRDVGTISAKRIEALTDGKLNESVVVRVNQRIFEYDQIIISGPVFPHEVVGFSGGNKYFFPGIAGQEIINLTHWLGALLTSYAIIGSGYTPVRAVIDEAAGMIDLPKHCFAWVLDHSGIAGVFFGTPEEAWEGAASLSAKRHIHTTGRTYQRALAVMPEMYEDLWVGGKGMYKLEPVIADGGELIIYAPHINEVSYTHGETIRKVGYHVVDYFLKQWQKFKDDPKAVLAHATHVKGLGTYDAQSGEEHPRIQVTLATGIPEETCRAINLGYRDPETIDPAAWEGREEEGILVVRDAGEQLYRVE